MKPFDDNDLIAYHMGELTPRRRRALERALRTDPTLAAESEAFAKTLATFKSDVPLAMDAEILARNWQAVKTSLPVYAAEAHPPSRWRTPALAAAGVAFAATVTLVALHRHPRSPSITMTATHPPGRTVRPTQPASEAHPPAGERLPENLPIAPVVGGQQYPGLHIQVSAPRGPEMQPTLHVISMAGEPPTFLAVAPPRSPGVTEFLPEAQALQGATSGGYRNARKDKHPAHRDHPADLTFAMGGTLIPSREAGPSGAYQRAQGATHAISAMAAFHQQFRPAAGYRVAFSYTRPDFQYGYNSAGTTGFSREIDGRIYELAATYVIEGPRRDRVSTSAEAGAGVLGILPNVPSANTSPNIRIAAVAGAAADIALTRHFSLHTAYRVQAFKGPDFNDTSIYSPAFGATLFSHEPVVGITYRFHPK